MLNFERSKRFVGSAIAVIALSTFPVPATAEVANPILSVEAQQMNRWFQEASAEFDVPLELLQAIAFSESRWQHKVAGPEADSAEVLHEQTLLRMKPKNAQADDHNQPASFGVMGLRDDAYFGHSLQQAATLLGRTAEELKANAQLNIRGAAALLSQLAGGRTRNNAVEEWEPAVAQYSGIPQPSVAEMHTFDIFNAIRSGRADEGYRISQKEVDMVQMYGEQRAKVLAAPRLTIDVPSNVPEDGEVSALSTDYGPAIWDPAASCNYSSRSGTAVTHVTIHTVQGSYAGAISWFKNCSASVSAHYVVRSSDGQITQMVREYDKAWHVGSENPYTVGIEHEGYVSDPARWYTTALYNASSALTRDICASHAMDRTKTYDGYYGWNAVLAKATASVKGHVNYPNQSHTDPGSGWDWPRYKSLVIGSNWSQTVDNLTTGRFTASANWGTSSYSAQRYGSDYRYANPAAVSDAAWFKFNIPATANYEVYAWYPASTGYNSATPYVIVTSAGNVTRTVNQQTNGGLWVSLGIHNLNVGDYDAVGVSRWSSAAGYVIADAVRLVRR